MDIVYAFSKKRKEFGRHVTFTTTTPQIIADIQPQPSLLDEYVTRSPSTQSVQAGPMMSEHWVNTDRFASRTQGMLHLEGGWPKDIDSSEVEPKVRYRKKVEKDDEYIVSVRRLGDEMEKYIKQNNAINIYEDYFTETVDHSSEPPTAKTVMVLRSPHTTQRHGAMSISWATDSTNPRRISIAYSSLHFQQSTFRSSMSSYIWDIESSQAPVSEIQPSSPLCVLQYNPRESNVLAGGSYNGLLGFWDLRKGSQAVDTSAIERSHRDPVYDLKWIQSKTFTEFFTTSTDGQVLWWDTRKIGEPTEAMMLNKPKLTLADSNVNVSTSISSSLSTSNDTDSLLGGCCLDYDASAPTKYLVGTEQGLVVTCTRKVKGAGERIVQTYSGHHGPIYSVQRNPFFPRYFLTVGDWSAKVWNEDLRTPLMSTRYHASYLTDATWSPTRPGVFFTTCRDGTLDIWDYLYKQYDPALSVQLSGDALSCVSISPTGKLAAVGSEDGSTTLLSLGEGLSVIQGSERVTIGQMFDREMKQEKTLEVQAKEAKAAALRKPPTGAIKPLSAATPRKVSSISLSELEKEFFEAIKEGDKNEDEM
eukprot:TRINITY_DN4297_c0_g1_i3.p1 TRINITY_DN4297_c0_g1~~TRINITY_DN4297_c0_g1_i3.p1  ORF type:complete len:588 (+),score=110.60 TRINITY_DN4297_c0_g1_i3:166-1929(+)